jgi:peptidoglycan-associated lipoprotein
MKKLLLPLLVLVACATAPKPTPAPEPEKTPAPATKPAEAEPVKAEVKPQDDIDALLKGLAIHFEFDKADLTGDSQKRLDALADKMRSNKGVHIKVAGNCDELGTEEYNLALGQKRAEAVKTYLGHLGIEGGRIETVSFGEEKPVDSSHTPAAHEANRRDDIAKN